MMNQEGTTIRFFSANSVPVRFQRFFESTIEGTQDGKEDDQEICCVLAFLRGKFFW
ncbi:MAG: hypothetical protein ACE5H7_06825 [Acidiferrobacterales bacterium]